MTLGPSKFADPVSGVPRLVDCDAIPSTVLLTIDFEICCVTNNKVNAAHTYTIPAVANGYGGDVTARHALFAEDTCETELFSIDGTIRVAILTNCCGKILSVSLVHLYDEDLQSKPMFAYTWVSGPKYGLGDPIPNTLACTGDPIYGGSGTLTIS